MSLLKKIRTEENVKVAYGQSLPTIVYFNQINPPNLQNIITKEVFITIPIVLYAKRDFYLLNAIDNQIKRLKDGGLIEFWYHQDVYKRSLNVNEPKRPKVLTMNRLLGCFQILLCGCTISFIVFLIELIAARVGGLMDNSSSFMSF